MHLFVKNVPEWRQRVISDHMTYVGILLCLIVGPSSKLWTRRWCGQGFHDRQHQGRWGLPYQCSSLGDTGTDERNQLRPGCGQRDARIPVSIPDGDRWESWGVVWGDIRTLSSDQEWGGRDTSNGGLRLHDRLDLHQHPALGSLQTRRVNVSRQLYCLGYSIDV